MNFSLNEEQAMIRDAARDFAQNELIKEVIDRDTNKRYPKEELRQMGEMGFMGMLVKSEYGGTGMDTLSYVLGHGRNIKRSTTLVRYAMSVQNSLVCSGIQAYASEELKNKYLTGIGKWGNVLGAFLAFRTRSRVVMPQVKEQLLIDKGDHYILVNGTKNWITNGKACRCCISSLHKPMWTMGHRGINAFIVDANS